MRIEKKSEIDNNTSILKTKSSTKLKFQKRQFILQTFLSTEKMCRRDFTTS